MKLSQNERGILLMLVETKLDSLMRRYEAQIKKRDLESDYLLMYIDQYITLKNKLINEDQ